VVSVAWNAYLSTLSHDAVLDTSQLLDLFDNAEDLLNSWVSLHTGAVQLKSEQHAMTCAAYWHVCAWVSSRQHLTPLRGRSHAT
jgi:hypothetical protein